MNPYQEEEKRQEAEKEELQNIYKIGMRSDDMSKTHRMGFYLCIFVVMVILMVLSLTFSAPMLEYDESEVYSCPQHLEYAPTFSVDSKTATFNSEQDKKVLRPPFSYDRELPFYDPFKCKPFYQDTTEPIWYSRVDNVKPENQHLIVYGFIHGEDAEDKN